MEDRHTIVDGETDDDLEGRHRNYYLDIAVGPGSEAGAGTGATLMRTSGGPFTAAEPRYRRLISRMRGNISLLVNRVALTNLVVTFTAKPVRCRRISNRLR